MQCLDVPLDGCGMPFGSPLSEGRFVRRLNRFAAEVEVEGGNQVVHVPNTGRMGQLLTPGNRVILADRRSPSRKTTHDLILAAINGSAAGEDPSWVLIDSRTPMDVFFRALEGGRIPEFRGYDVLKRERTLGESRFDFHLSGPEERSPCWVELKSVTFATCSPWGREARFPDAPTARGVRHLQHLMEAVIDGHRCAVVFAVCRPDAGGAAPNEQVDPLFAGTLWEAASAGVEVYAYRFLSDPREGCRLEDRLPVRISKSG